MTLKVFIRLFLSALIAFVSYASWAYYANSLVTSDPDILLKSALVQGFYSGGITLFFTVLLEVFYKKFGSSAYCLPFIVPTINAKPTTKNKCTTLETFEASFALSEKKCKGSCLPGELISPLPALLIQSVMVVSVNVAFSTPNLWLTVAPSIIFSGIYGYMYSIALARKKVPIQ
ncbi:MAG: hypothetical protein ACJA0G_001801 [Kangiellaceae bacterium]|jgi:hypothetical protein